MSDEEHPKVRGFTRMYKDAQVDYVMVTVTLTQDQAIQLANPWMGDTRPLVTLIGARLTEKLQLFHAQAQADRFSPDELAEARRKHRPVGTPPSELRCEHDKYAWPCPTARWLATVDEAQADWP